MLNNCLNWMFGMVNVDVFYSKSSMHSTNDSVLVMLPESRGDGAVVVSLSRDTFLGVVVQ